MEGQHGPLHPLQCGTLLPDHGPALTHSGSPGPHLVLGTGGPQTRGGMGWGEWAGRSGGGCSASPNPLGLVIPQATSPGQDRAILAIQGGVGWGHTEGGLAEGARGGQGWHAAREQVCVERTCAWLLPGSPCARGSTVRARRGEKPPTRSSVGLGWLRVPSPPGAACVLARGGQGVWCGRHE